MSNIGVDLRVEHGITSTQLHDEWLRLFRAGVEAEKVAASKLILIKDLLRDESKKSLARERLERLAKEHPDTKAAQEAREILKKIGH